MIIDFYELETKNLFRALTEYQGIMESQLPMIIKAERKKLDAWAKSESIPDGEYFAELDGHEWTYTYFFPRSLRYSFVVLLFLTVENRLTFFCDALQKRQELPIRANELGGDVINRCKKYIQKIAVLPIEGWEFMEDLSKIRNCIVHTLGTVALSRDETRLRQIAKQGIGISISDSEFGEEGVLLITADFCELAVSKAKKFFEDALDTADFKSDFSDDSFEKLIE